MTTPDFSSFQHRRKTRAPASLPRLRCPPGCRKGEVPRQSPAAGGATVHTRETGTARGHGRRACYLFCQPWRRLVYLLSTPSSAGSLLRPPPPDGLAATEPGLLRLPPPPSPAAADRPATPRPDREQEGEEPAEVARLLLRLLLLLPPPPPLSALWVVLSMIPARLGRGWPPRWQPHRRRLSCRRRCCSSGLPGRAWLLRFPGKCLTHTGGRGGGGKEGWEGSQPSWMQLRPPLLPPRPGPGPALPPLPGQVRGSRSLLHQLLALRDRSEPGLEMLLGLAGQTGWARPRSAPCTLAFFLLPPTRIPRGDGEFPQVLPSNPNPPRDLEGGTALPTRSTRIWTRPVPDTRTLPLRVSAHRSLGQARTQSPEN